MNFCLPARCGLCRISLAVDDEIVIVRSNGFVSEILHFQSIIIEGDDTYVLCCGVCPQDEQAVGCHVECNRIVPKIRRLALIEASRYKYEPLPIQEQRRSRWLCSRWSCFIQQKYRLPAELCSRIARDSLQHFAIINAMLSLDTSPSTPPIRISKTTWARFTDFEGIRYITSLIHKKDGDISNSLESSPPIFVAEDHLGIRGLREGVGSPSQGGRIGIWWRKARAPASHISLWTDCDGVKLRHLSIGDPISTALWAIPCSSVRELRWDNLQKVHRNIHPPQMSLLLLNDPTIFGYSVCFTSGIAAMHAHTLGEDTDFYHSISHHDAVWLYIPIHQDEWVSQIWKRQGFDTREQAFMFGTSKGRRMTAGVYRGPSNFSTWKLLDRPMAQRSHIFFESSSRSVLRLALETPSPNLGGTPPSSPQPSSLPKCQPMEDYFYTWAILDDITIMRPCYGRQGGVQAIIGLLFSDTDGQESCAGQIRYDCLGSPKKTSLSEKLWLGFSLGNGEPRVVRVETSNPCGETGNISWFDIPWKGKLEWWFSFRQCKVYHKGRTSPETRIDFGR